MACPSALLREAGVTHVISFNGLFTAIPESYEERIVMMAAKESRNSQAFPGHSHAYLDIGFTDSSNPFYLFSKLNAGLLLLAPSAPTMREEHPLLIALEADRRTLMSINHTSRTGDRAELHADAIVSDCLTDHRRSTDESQIAQPKFVGTHGCFTVGGR
jgi:hypothetical protein